VRYGLNGSQREVGWCGMDWMGLREVGGCGMD
jgi:hypothetical protein